MQLKFRKYSGAGNDFILIDSCENDGLNLNSALIKFLCDRRNGIGADGILYILNSATSDFELQYYNSDGFLGSLCGNGSRCAIRYAYENKKFNGKRTKFTCGNEEYFGELTDDGLVSFLLKSPSEIKLNLDLTLKDGIKVKADYINTGSPHLVVDISDASNFHLKRNKNFWEKEFPIIEYGRALRYHEFFAPKGTNVNFIEINGNKIKIRTYERGVEDETLACGTGSVAAALLCNIKYNISPVVELMTIGGESLFVDFKKDGDKFNQIWLTGVAKEVFSGIINI